MNLNRRVGRPEQADVKRRGSVMCAACGFAVHPEETPTALVSRVVPMPSVIGDALPEFNPADDLCGCCARRLVYRIPKPRVVCRAS